MTPTGRIFIGGPQDGLRTTSENFDMFFALPLPPVPVDGASEGTDALAMPLPTYVKYERKRFLWRGTFAECFIVDGMTVEQAIERLDEHYPTKEGAE